MYLKNKAITNQKHTIVSQKSKRRYKHNITENHQTTFCEPICKAELETHI